jgi:hypothetical protein
MVLSDVAWQSPRAPHAANTGYICCCFYACGHLRGQTQTMSWWLANQQWRWCAHGHISLLARCVQHRGVQCCGCLALGCCRWQPGVKVLPCVALLLLLIIFSTWGKMYGNTGNPALGPAPQPVLASSLLWAADGLLWLAPALLPQGRGGGLCICARYSCCRTGVSCAAADLLACSAASL